MEIGEHAHEEPATVPRHPVDAARDSWEDRALEDTFPASDPVAPNLFD